VKQADAVRRYRQVRRALRETDRAIADARARGDYRAARRLEQRRRLLCFVLWRARPLPRRGRRPSV
jgi:hypothetical protein